MKWKPIVALLIATALGVSTTYAQTCESLSAALEALAATCPGMSRGDLCHEGQIISLAGVHDFTIDTLALAQIQSSYPDVAPGRFVNLAFVGPIKVQPVSETAAEALPERVPVYVVVVGTKANVRAQPVRNGDPPVAKLDNGTVLEATGVSRSGTWTRVQLPDQPMQAAWINTSLLASDYDMNALSVVSANDPLPQYPQFTLMQAFSLSDAAPCAGVLLQSGDDPARLRVNGIDLELNQATAFIQNTGDSLRIEVLEGVVQVQVQAVTTTGVAGVVVSVPLAMSAAPEATPESTPDAPIPYDQAALERFNGTYFQRSVAAAPAANMQAIQDALVTPLSGRWRIDYPPPYTYKSLEGGDCGEMKVKQPSPIFDITISDDGSSLSTFNHDMTLGAGVRAYPGMYELTDFKFEVLSPTEMTATYDTNPRVACTSIITINAHWIGPQR